MKRKLLYLTTIVLFTAFSSINAQTKYWDFGNSTTDWALNATGYSATTTIDKLTLVPGTSSSFAVIDGNNYTFAADGFSSTKRLKFGATSNATNNLPTRNYLTFPVTGNCNIKVWFRTASQGNARSLYVSDGVNLVGSAITGAGAGLDHAILNVNYSGPATTLYVYGDSVNLYKMEVSGVGISTLGTNEFSTEDVASVFSNGKLVFVSDVKSDTKVDVYGISGVLVKSFTTGSDTSFDLNTGIYVVKSKSAEGEKSAKILVN